MNLEVTSESLVIYPLLNILKTNYVNQKNFISLTYEKNKKFVDNYYNVLKIYDNYEESIHVKIRGKFNGRYVISIYSDTKLLKCYTNNFKLYDESIKKKMQFNFLNKINSVFNIIKKINDSYENVKIHFTLYNTNSIIKLNVSKIINYILLKKKLQFKNIVFLIVMAKWNLFKSGYKKIRCLKKTKKKILIKTTNKIIKKMKE